MFVKFRRKGVIEELFVGHEVPENININIPNGYDGLDLTSYSVMSFYGKSTRRKIEEFKEKNQSFTGIFVWYENSGFSFGEGVIFPADFNQNRLKFFKSIDMIKKEKESQNVLEIKEVIEKYKDNSLGLKFHDFTHHEYHKNGAVGFPEGGGFYFYNWESFKRACQQIGLEIN